MTGFASPSTCESRLYASVPVAIDVGQGIEARFHGGIHGRLLSILAPSPVKRPTQTVGSCEPLKIELR